MGQELQQGRRQLLKSVGRLKSTTANVNGAQDPRSALSFTATSLTSFGSDVIYSLYIIYLNWVASAAV